MTKDAQIRLLCEQQDQLNEEAREYKAEVARLTAELVVTTAEKDSLAVALYKYGVHEPYCYESKTTTEKGFVAPTYRQCTCGFSAMSERLAAILATARAKARAEGMRLLLREFSHWTPWGTRDAVCDRIRAMMADAGEAGNMDGDK